MGWVYRTRQSGYSAPAGPISGFFMVLLAVAMLGGAAWTGKNTYALVSQGIHIDGKVIGVKSSLETSTRTRNGFKETVTETKYRYTIGFKDNSGSSHEFQDSMVTSSPDHKEGDTVPVLYLENDPQKSATIDHGMMNWLLPGALGFMGLIFGGCGAAAMLGIGRRGNAPLI